MGEEYMEELYKHEDAVAAAVSSTSASGIQSALSLSLSSLLL